MKPVQIKKKKHLEVSSRELYNHYLELQEPNEFTLDYNKWKKIIFEVMKRISRLMIVENLIVRTSSSLGSFGVEKAKGKAKRRIDFARTKELGRTIFHDNLHTNCYYFKIAWRKKTQHHFINKNIGVYRMLAVLDAKDRYIGRRGLSAWITFCSEDPYTKDYDAPFKI